MRIVLTGSSGGIGRALAERLLEHGHQVWGLARSDQSGFAAQHPGAFLASCCDVANWAQVSGVVRDILARWPEIGGLVACAGWQGAIGPVAEVDPVRWSATVRTNLDGTFNILHALLPALRSGPRRAKIVCFSGGGATKARPNFSAYGVAKTAVVRLVETVSEEERGAPIDINAVAPGAIHTQMTDEVIAAGPSVAGDAEYQAALKQRETDGAPLARALDLVEWLLSPASDGISGRLISAPWDPWPSLAERRAEIAGSNVYTLRRITPEDRG